jgi:DNA-binding CsgD family transcriptional regulator
MRRMLLTGLGTLTASERRIAELVASGLTNREIAQTLFITARTVEGHLTHILHKLDVKARSALPAALSAPTQAVRSKWDRSRICKVCPCCRLADPRSGWAAQQSSPS